MNPNIARLCRPYLTFAVAIFPLRLWAESAQTEVVQLENFVVTPGHYQASNASVTSPLVISSETLKALPQFADDLYRSIGHFPGVAVDDYSARFWVRGAPHEQILTRLDGVDLLEPFHFKDFDGSLSIVDPSSVDRFTLHTGGFTSEFGNASAAVIEFDTDAVSASRLRSTVNGSLTGFRLANEGTFAQGQGEWLVAGRLGLPELTLAMLDDSKVKADYHDLRGKVAYQLNSQHRLSLNFLRSDDHLRFQEANEPLLTSSYQSNYLWARLLSDWNPVLHSETILSATGLDTLRRGDGLLSPLTQLHLRDRRELRRLQLRQDWSYTATNDLYIRGGFEIQHDSCSYDYTRFRQQEFISSDGNLAVSDESVAHHLKPTGNEFGLYLTPRIRVLSDWIIEPGVRFDRSSIDHAYEVSPRFNSSKTFGLTTVRLGWGLYRQRQDLSQVGVADSDLAFYPSERTEQRTFSIERAFGSYQFRVEAYDRRSKNPRPHYENLEDGQDTFLEIRPDRIALKPTESRANAVELNLSRRTRHFDISGNYTLSKTEEKIVGHWTSRSHDQRHALGLNVVYTPNERWRYAASWQYHTGWAKTDISYGLATLADGRQVLVSHSDGLYNARLPAYHRLDLRVSRRFRWGNKTGEIYLDLNNAYNHENLIGYTPSVQVQKGGVVVSREAETQFPILPNLGFSLEF